MTIEDERAALERLEREYLDGIYTKLEMSGRYARWLGSTEHPSQWWPLVGDHVRQCVLEQISNNASGGEYFATDSTPEEERRYRDLLAKLALILGL